MSIIRPLDFIRGEFVIANADNTNTAADIQWFIDKYEPEFLRQLLCEVLAKEFQMGLEQTPVADKWTSLSKAVVPLIVPYVYYWYTRNKVSLPTSTGEKRAANQNSYDVSVNEKLVKAWNDMVSGCCSLVHNWDVVTFGDYYISLYGGSYYGNYGIGCWFPDIFKPINTLGL